MLRRLNTKFDRLDPILRDCCVSFLIAIQKFHPSVLRDLESISVQRISGAALERALNMWSKNYRLYSWIAEIALATLYRWERSPIMSRTTWKLPQVQSAAVWDAAPFSFTHRGYHPHIDGDLHAHKATLRKDFEKTLANHIDRLKESALRQSDQSLGIVQKRSREHRDKNIGIEWLVKSLAGTSLTKIAKEAEIDRAAVVRQVNWAKSVLSAR